MKTQKLRVPSWPISNMVKRLKVQKKKKKVKCNCRFKDSRVQKLQTDQNPA